MRETERRLSFRRLHLHQGAFNESLGLFVLTVAFSAYVPANFPLGNELEPAIVLGKGLFTIQGNSHIPSGGIISAPEVEIRLSALLVVTEIVSFVAVDDFGHVINPMIVEGQVHGGLAQGIGQALMEHGVYDDNGQLVTGSYMDYVMPRADDLPNFVVDTTVTPCTHNPLGVKGCGEAGAIGSTAAVMNAITDALDVKDLSMPASPENVWRAARALVMYSFKYHRVGGIERRPKFQ